MTDEGLVGTCAFKSDYSFWSIDSCEVDCRFASSFDGVGMGFGNTDCLWHKRKAFDAVHCGWFTSFSPFWVLV